VLIDIWITGSYIGLCILLTEPRAPLESEPALAHGDVVLSGEAA
jgi:hypothetical protein